MKDRWKDRQEARQKDRHGMQKQKADDRKQETKYARLATDKEKKHRRQTATVRKTAEKRARKQTLKAEKGHR